MKMFLLAIALSAFALWLDGYHIVWKPTPDQLYGCTVEQQAPNGDLPMSALSEHYAGKECPGDFMKTSGFVAWHPIHGFGPVNEIAIREQYDHAKTDVRLLSHTGDKLWQVVKVELKAVQPNSVLASQSFGI